MPQLDPWLDAAELARRLRTEHTELLVVLGAEAWCTKCQRLRPLFDQLAANLPTHIAALWLDLEDHAEFIGTFVPPDLPLLLRWNQGRCVQAAVVQDIQPDVLDPTRRVLMQTLELRGDHLLDGEFDTPIQLPPLWILWSADSGAQVSGQPQRN